MDGPARPRGRFLISSGVGLLVAALLLPIKAGAGGGPRVLGFTNTAPITINDVYSYASPYPSTIQVPPLPGALQSVTVTLYGLSEPDTSGIEMLLAGPSGLSGPTVDLMCLAGTAGQVNGLTITLADTNAPFPTETTITSGRYQPSGDPASDSPFPGYSPFFQEGGNQLSDFIGTTLNGTWNLEVYYDSIAGGNGAISGGWSLQFTLLPAAPDVTNQPASDITTTSATLNATISPNLSATTNCFEYGLTAGYGNFSATNILSSDLVDAQSVAQAITGLPPATTIHFQAVAWNSAGTNFGGDATFSTPAAGPGLAAVADQSVAVNSTLLVSNTVTNEPAAQITFSLGAGAPAGSSISSGGIFQWTPVCEQGSATNLITVWAIDSEVPPQSNSVSFNVAVGDCVQVTVGSNTVLTGNTTSIPVSLYSTVSLTNLNFSLATLAGRFSNWGVASGNPGTVGATVQASNPSQPQFNFAVQSGGPALLGGAALGTISVQAVAGGNWALAPLIVTNIAATASNGAPAGPDFGQSGSLLLIAAQPSLQASVANGSALVLTLYGNPGSNYTVVTATNLAPPITWTVLTNLTLTNAVQAINAGPATNSMEFFAIQTVTPAPPALAASLGVGASFVLTLYGNAGSSYAILAATNLAPPVAWTTLTNVTLTNAIQVINPGPLTNSMEFFSAQQQ